MANEGHHMVHGEFTGGHLLLTVVAYASGYLALPPLGLSQAPGFFFFAPYVFG